MIPAGFRIEELVPRAVFSERGKLAEWLLCPAALLVLGQIRADFGPCVVNDWLYGGRNEFRGFRPAGCPVGAAFSQHRYGRAFDVITTKTPVEAARQEIIRQARAGHQVYSLIGGIELGVSWLHFDTRSKLDGTLQVFRP